MRRFSVANLSFRLNLLVLIAILPAIGLVFYAYRHERQLQKAYVQNQALLLTQVVKSQEEQLIEGARQLLIALAQSPQVRDSNPASCNAFFSDLLKQYPLYATLGVAEQDGDVFCSAVPRLGVDISDRPWLQRTVEQRDFAVGDYQIGRISRKPVIVFGYPVLDSSEQVQSVVFASLDLTWLNQLVERVQLPEGAAVILVDRNGTVLAHQPDPKAWVGKTIPNAAVVKTILSQGEGVAEIADDMDGMPRFYAFTQLRNLPDANVYLGVGIPEVGLFGEADRALLLNLIGLGLFAVATKIVVVSFGGDWLILRWVRQLTKVSQQLAAGNLSARVGLPDGPGELSQLARSFDEMADSLERQMTERQQAEAEVRQLNSNLEQRVQQRTAQLEAANNELDAFSYSVSHDLRTPLRHINGFVDALARHLHSSQAIADAQVAHYIAVIQCSSQKMGQMIESLLTLSQLGRQQLVTRPVNLRQLVDRAIAFVSDNTASAADSSVEFTVGHLPTVMGDATLLQQVFTNLIDNAVKFSRGCQPAKIAIGALPDGTIFVKDNGVGFHPEYSERLFEVFQRLHSEQEFPGTGIGLTIVQRIIQRHGGVIWAESQPNQGATFYLRLEQVVTAS